MTCPYPADSETRANTCTNRCQRADSGERMSRIPGLVWNSGTRIKAIGAPPPSPVTFCVVQSLYAGARAGYGARMARPTVAIALLLTVSCSAPGGSASTSPPASATAAAATVASTTPAVASLDVADCPVADDAFCAAAVEVADALRRGDADALVALSAPDMIVCAEMNLEYFPGCTTADRLEGYGLSGPNLVVEFYGEDEFATRVRAITADTDTDEVPAFSVGTCGPNVPGRRTYHLAWAADSLIGSFEMRFDEEWRIVLFYAGAPVTEWESSQSFPIDELFCSATATPWPG